MPSDCKPSLILSVALAALVAGGALTRTLWREPTTAVATSAPSRVESAGQVSLKPVAVVETQILRLAPEIIVQGGPYRFSVFNAGDAPLKLRCGSQGFGGVRVSDVPEGIPPLGVGRLKIEWKPPEGDITEWKETVKLLTNDGDRKVIRLVVISTQ